MYSDFFSSLTLNFSNYFDLTTIKVPIDESPSDSNQDNPSCHVAQVSPITSVTGQNSVRILKPLINYLHGNYIVVVIIFKGSHQ